MLCSTWLGPVWNPEQLIRVSRVASDVGIGLPWNMSAGAQNGFSSQYFANFFLDGFDHWVRASLRCHGYARYMDDFVLFHNDPATLKVWEDQISDWLLVNRGLRLKQERHTGRSSDGVPFLGYRIKSGRVLLTRRSRRRFALRLRQYLERFHAGELTERELQRRLDSVQSFLLPADCARWRHRVVATTEHQQDV
jgi:hypothetical protein